MSLLSGRTIGSFSANRHEAYQPFSSWKNISFQGSATPMIQNGGLLTPTQDVYTPSAYPDKPPPTLLARCLDRIMNWFYDLSPEHKREPVYHMWP